LCARTASIVPIAFRRSRSQSGSRSGATPIVVEALEQLAATPVARGARALVPEAVRHRVQAFRQRSRVRQP
jgi:hypothetical protein